MTDDNSFGDSASLSQVANDAQAKMAIIAILEKGGTFRIESKTGPDYRFEGGNGTYLRIRISDNVSDYIDLSVVRRHLDCGEGMVYVEET